MGDEIYREIFSRNLRKYMELNDKKQNDIIRDLGINKSTISSWVNGTKLPRMDKVDALAKYFGVKRSDLIEDKPANKEPDPQPAYYTDSETARLAQEMFEDPDMRSLFSMKRNMDPKQFRNYIDFMKAQYRLEHPED